MIQLRFAAKGIFAAVVFGAIAPVVLPAHAEHAHQAGPEEFVYCSPSTVTPGIGLHHCTVCGAEMRVEVAAVGYAYAQDGTAEILAREAALGDEDGVVYVARNGADEPGRGAKATPFATITGAITNTTASPLEIRVLHGVYAEADPTTIPYNRSITIRSAAGDRDAVVIDAQDGCVGITIANYATLTLRDLSIVRAKNTSTDSIYQGTAVHCGQQSVVVISNCMVAASTSVNSTGGISFYSCKSANLIDSQIVACTNLNGGGWGPGGGLYSSGSAITGSRFALCYSAHLGGGVGILGGSLTNCTFYGNAAGTYGGGLYLLHSAVGRVFGCRFENNAALSSGGGMATSTDASRLIENCLFDGNAAKSLGGGLYLFWSESGGADDVVVRNCTLRNNRAENGGGLAAEHPRGGVYGNLTVEDNEATNGGGLYLKHCSDQWRHDARTIELRQCLVKGNRASANGAGVYAASMSSNWVLNACSVVANTNTTLTKEGAGFYFASRDWDGSTPALRNMVIANNAAEGATASKVDFAAASSATSAAGWDDAITYCAVPHADAQIPSDAAHHNVLGGDFKFTDAAAGDYRPGIRSPLVDAGKTESWMPGRAVRDLSGRRRLSGAAADIGAYEYQRKGVIFVVK